MSHIIPPITNPLGAHWNQPKTDGILIDDTHALMSKKDFNALLEYSCSVPSGVYEGKMWKACPSKFFRDAPKGWFLRWYGFSENPDCCSNHLREIIVVE